MTSRAPARFPTSARPNRSPPPSKWLSDKVSAPTQAGENWVVFRVAAHELPNPDDLAKQRDDIQQQLLQTKQNAAFDAFHTQLIDRLKKEGKLTINTDAVKRAAT